MEPAAFEEESVELDSALLALTPDGSLLSMGVERPGAADSWIEGLVLPADGIYQIQARSFHDQSACAFTPIIEVEGEEG